MRPVSNIPDYKRKEQIARRAIEDHGFTVHDANIIFNANCPNVDLVVFGEAKAVYVQVKSSSKPATKDGVVVEGSGWTKDQLNGDAPLFNRHNEHFKAALIFVVDHRKDGTMNFYIAPPEALEDVCRESGRAWAKHPKKDGTVRSLGFRKELSREQLKDWLEAWHLLNSLLEVSK